MRERLEQIMDLRNEIEQLEKEIDRIKRTVKQDKVTGSLSEFPYTKTSFTITGYNYASNCETRGKEAEAARKLLELHDLTREIDQWLRSVESSKIRQIITYRYFDGLTWNDVAAKMGYRYSADGCRMTLKRFLKKY